MKDTTDLIIRPECVTDYTDISSLHVHAFGNRPGESLIVALQRLRRVFDPELSLVAELHGRMVGHVLFSPQQLHLLDQMVPAVNLAPIAVEPAYQGQGIGGQLISEGHRVAAAKGYKVSFLLGHSTYYPRFGYHMHAFGVAQMAFSNEAFHEERLEVRGPLHEEGPTLYNLWCHEEGAVDMGLEPGLDMLDWLSPHPAVRATVYIRASEVVGYTRIHSEEPSRPRIFLARDHEAARAMVVTMGHTLSNGAAGTQYALPLHPSSASAGAFGPIPVTCQTFAAAMACALGPSPLEDYVARVQEGRRPPGRVIWPVAFDLG